MGFWHWPGGRDARNLACNQVLQRVGLSNRIQQFLGSENTQLSPDEREVLVHVDRREGDWEVHLQRRTSKMDGVEGCRSSPLY